MNGKVETALNLIAYRTASDKLSLKRDQVQLWSEIPGFPDHDGKVDLDELRDWAVSNGLMADPLLDDEHGNAPDAPAATLRLVRFPVCLQPSSEPRFTPRNLSTRLQSLQREGLARLRDGLLQENAKLKDGRPVDGNAAAIRWLLEQIALAGTDT